MSSYRTYAVTIFGMEHQMRLSARNQLVKAAEVMRAAG